MVNYQHFIFKCLLVIAHKNNLMWNQQLEVAVGKVMSALMVYRGIAEQTWSWHKKIVQWIYTMIVRLII